MPPGFREPGWRRSPPADDGGLQVHERQGEAFSRRHLGGPLERLA